MTILKVGVIGAGGRARVHLFTLLKLSDRYRVIAICDVNAARAKEVAEKTRAKPYLDLEKMLDREKIDACLIAVQAEGHHILSKMLAERGVHVLTETPMAITLACADQMIEAARENGVFLEVSENVPRWPQERLKQRIVASNVLGDIGGFYLSYLSGSYHGVAAIRSIIGSEVKSAVGEFPPFESILEEGILERAEISFLNGVEGVYEFNLNRGNYWEIIGDRGALRGNKLFLSGGEEFEIRLELEKVNMKGEDVIVGAKVDTSPEICFQDIPREYLLTSYDEVAVADAWISLHEAIIDGKPLSYGAENARKDIEVLVAIRESALQEGVRINLPLKGITEYEKLVHSEFMRVYGVDPLEIEPHQLKVKYVLPIRLRHLMYCGRALQNLKRIPKKLLRLKYLWP
ncbi:Gfo/Idh/MocA family oxidoreductase [Candidatus Bathyarchaeota archaeon]|nr:Gfo/Idh/MocA family oxidoreductase [Candidatus Bathyarchaeota archaeon]